MISYRFKPKDVFTSNGDFFIVTRVLKDKIIAIKRPINLKGKLSDNWQSAVFQLDDKTDVATLNQSQQNELPTTSIAEVGSMVMYGEEIYMYCGNADLALGAMVLSKPYLINIDGLIMDIEDNFDGQSLELLLPKNIKQPLDSDKNIVIFEVAPAQRAIQTITKIEPIIQEETTAKAEFIPVASNASDRDVKLPPNYFEYLQVGVQFNFWKNLSYTDFITISLPANRYPRRYSSELERQLVNFRLGDYNRIDIYNQPTQSYSLSENESVYPDWKLKTDSEFPTGTGIKFKKTDEGIVVGKIVIPNYQTFGSTAIVKNDFVKNINLRLLGEAKYPLFLFHPEVYQGGNKEFKNSPKDLFLTISKFPLTGSKSKGFNSIEDKPIGSTQFPEKTRAQLQKEKTISISNKSLNYKSYDDKFEQPLMFVPYEYAEEITTSYPSYVFPEGRMGSPNQNVVDSLIQPYTYEYSWQLYSLISETVSKKSSDDEIRNQILEYFDYQNLSVIQNKNPELYWKISKLVGKAITMYLENLPKKKKSKVQSDAISNVVLFINNLHINLRTHEEPNNNNTISIRNLEDWKRYELTYQTIGEEINKFYNEIGELILENPYNIKTVYGSQEYFSLTLQEHREFLKSCHKFIKNSIKKAKGVASKTEVEFSINNNLQGFMSNYSSAINFAWERGKRDFGQFLVKGGRSYRDWNVFKIEIGYHYKVEVEIHTFEDPIVAKEFDQLVFDTCYDFGEKVFSIEGLFQKIYLLENLLPIYGYYQFMEESGVGVSYEDISTDIRFRTWLMEAAIFEPISTNLIAEIERVFDSQYQFYDNLLKLVKKFVPNNSRKQSWRNEFWEVPTVNLGKALNERFNQLVAQDEGMYKRFKEFIGEYEKKLPESFYINNRKESFGNIMMFLSYNSDYVVNDLKSLFEKLKKNTDVKNLLEGKVTAEDLLLKLYGGGSLVQVVEEEEDEPEVVVETVDETVNVEEEINWDDIDTDDIDIMLDIDFDEDSIEI